MTLNIILITVIVSFIVTIIGGIVLILYIQEPLLKFHIKRSTEKQQRRKEIERKRDRTARRILSNPLDDIRFRQRYIHRANRLYFIIIMIFILFIGAMVCAAILDFLQGEIRKVATFLLIIFGIAFIPIYAYSLYLVVPFARDQRLMKKMNEIRKNVRPKHIT